MDLPFGLTQPTPHAEVSYMWLIPCIMNDLILYWMSWQVDIAKNMPPAAEYDGLHWVSVHVFLFSCRQKHPFQKQEQFSKKYVVVTHMCNYINYVLQSA